MSKEYIEALKVIKNIKLSHVETEEDEDFDGNWVYDTIEVNDGLIGDKYSKQIKILKQALQRLEAIDNANPSEALKELNYIGNNCYEEAENAEEDCILYAKNYIGFDTIKQALLKAQENENRIDIEVESKKKIIQHNFALHKENAKLKRVLEIISEKQVDIEYLNKCNDVKEYNAHWCDERFYLTQEEFDLLKSWLDNKKEQ